MMRQPEARSGSKILEESTCMAFFEIFESNSEVPGSEMASHLELRETRTPEVHDVNGVDVVDVKHLEQSFPDLEKTKELLDQCDRSRS